MMMVNSVGDLTMRMWEIFWSLSWHGAVNKMFHFDFKTSGRTKIRAELAKKPQFIPTRSPGPQDSTAPPFSGLSSRPGRRPGDGFKTKLVPRVVCGLLESSPCLRWRKTDERDWNIQHCLYIYICMYTVLYYIMLYKISYIVVLYYTILYYIILYCFILYYCILYLSYYILYIVYVYLCWGCQKMGDCPPIGHQMSMTARPQLQWG